MATRKLVNHNSARRVNAAQGLISTFEFDRDNINAMGMAQEFVRLQQKRSQSSYFWLTDIVVLLVRNITKNRSHGARQRVSTSPLQFPGIAQYG